MVEVPRFVSKDMSGYCSLIPAADSIDVMPGWIVSQHGGKHAGLSSHLTIHAGGVVVGTKVDLIADDVHAISRDKKPTAIIVWLYLILILIVAFLSHGSKDYL
jgi:hypothetical protein